MQDQHTEVSGGSQETAADPASPKRKYRRRFEPGTPKEALTWKSAQGRSKALFDWQCAIIAKFGESHRMLRVAWLIFTLCQKEGYAYGTDAYMGEVLGIQVNNLQAALSKLEKAGAIVRASVFVKGKPQRRIWPATKIIPLTVRGMDTPHRKTRDTPHGEGTDSIRKNGASKTVRKTGISSTADAARACAELREQKERERRELRVVAGTDIEPEAPEGEAQAAVG
jgi:hypothetical protein